MTVRFPRPEWTGLAGRGRRSDHHSRRALVIWFRPQLHRARLRARQGVRGPPQWKTSHGWPGRRPTAIFFALVATTLAVMTWLAVAYPEAERVGILHIPDDARDRLFISLIMTAASICCGSVSSHRPDRGDSDRRRN